jgi:hypothetical protein
LEILPDDVAALAKPFQEGLGQLGNLGAPENSDAMDRLLCKGLRGE